MHQAGGVRTVDVVHRDPPLPLKLAPVVHTNDVRVRERCGDVGFAGGPLPEYGVR